MYTKEGELQCSKSTYAQCSNVLQNKEVLDKLVEMSPSITAKNQGLLHVLLYELLLGPNKSIRGGGALKRQLVSQQESLKKKLTKIQNDIHPQIGNHLISPPSTIPRYVRINTLVADREEVVKEMQKRIKIIYADPQIPDLYVVEPTAENRSLLQDLVVSQKVILQDKASCFSAFCLMDGFQTDNDDIHPEQEYDYLDACAAPGNKTSHLAALVHDQKCNGNQKNNIPLSTIHAFDKSSDRYKLLKRRMDELVPQGIVKCYNMDFLEVKPSNDKTKNSVKGQNDGKTDRENRKFQKVQSILLDPSCSGSGMTTTCERSASRDPFFSDDRIKSLSNFQFQALMHATTNFPSVNRLVYSTCSLYVQENEGVIGRLINATNGEWEVVAPHCLSNWHRRGIITEKEDDYEGIGLTTEQAKCLIRVNPDEDATSGFFVACLQRKAANGHTTKQRKSTWELPAPPIGIEIYRGQFDTKHKNETITKDEDIVKAASSPNNKPVTTGKRKINETSPPSSSSDDKTHKKKAKKMEWKRKQRLEKKERLRRKQDQK